MPFAPRPSFEWKLRTRTLHLGARTRIMGIVNVTPDSFSDGGEYATTDAALAHALQLLNEGADILDIGGESTRPGSAAGTQQALSAGDEQRRVLPVLEAILQARPHTILSVDTYRASTAREALHLGAEIVNDVSGMQWDAAMAALCAQTQCGIIAMHTRGLPSEWASQPTLQQSETIPTILQGLRESVTKLQQAGCNEQSIVLDPGFGFGKRGNENWHLLHHFAELQQLNFPLLAGLSRKGFLRGAVLDQSSRDELDTATATASAFAAAAGAHIVRVHNVRATAAALRLVDAING